MKSSHLNLLTCIVALAALVLSGCSSESQPQRTVRGQVTAYYEIQASPSSTVGTGPNGEEVQEIQFFENYIILERDETKGTLIPLRKINSFRWKKKGN